MRAVLLAVAMLMLVMPPQARANWTAPGQEPAAPIIGDLADRAETFWHQHGLYACPDGITTWEAPALDIGGQDAWGAGDGTTCGIWVSRDLVDSALDPFWIGAAIQACTAVTHEVGHAYGLPHSARGVMSITGAPAKVFGWAPRFCFRWARFEFAAAARGDGNSERAVRAMVRYQEHLIHTPA